MQNQNTIESEEKPHLLTDSKLGGNRIEMYPLKQLKRKLI